MRGYIVPARLLRHSEEARTLTWKVRSRRLSWSRLIFRRAVLAANVLDDSVNYRESFFVIRKLVLQSLYVRSERRNYFAVFGPEVESVLIRIGRFRRPALGQRWNIRRWHVGEVPVLREG